MILAPTRIDEPTVIQPKGTPSATARLSMDSAISGLVAKATRSGMPARQQRVCPNLRLDNRIGADVEEVQLSAALWYAVIGVASATATQDCVSNSDLTRIEDFLCAVFTKRS